MNRQDTLAESILATKPLFTRFVSGFDDASRAAQTPELPNHVIWCLGHCALTMHRVAERFDDNSLPETDFIQGDASQGDEARYDTESVCFDSTPSDNPALYPTLARGVEVFEAACDRFASAVRSATDEALDSMIPWHDGEMPLWKLIMRVCFHNGAHAGQITDLRRAMGMTRVIGG